MGRNLALGPSVRPASDEFMAVSRRLKFDASARIAKCLWDAYDLLQKEVLSSFVRDSDDYVLECSITDELEPRIRRSLSGAEPFDVQHASNEWATRLPGSSRPPVYDIAFVLRGHSQTKWPVEAKVLRTPGQVSAYVDDLKNQFLTCRYAPFSSEGAMVGYLLKGAPNAALSAIARSVPCILSGYAHAPGRPHKTSDHLRSVPAGQKSPLRFRCHHLILTI